MGAILGPLLGLLIWLLPLGLEPAAHKACAIVAFMVIYWVTVPIDYSLTALSGCFLFWAVNATSFSVAFSGFSSSSPWFVLGALLIGQSAARTGLAKRLGYLIMQKVGSSYSSLLFGIILLSLLLQFLVPSPNAQITILASVAIGFVSMPASEMRSNVGKGLFLALTFASGYFSKMFLAGGPAILTRGIIEEQTGVQILWSHWALAFLPLTLLTLVACWLIIYWLYPPETSKLTESSQYLQDALHAMGSWRVDEKKTLGWLVLAIALWCTDFLHHMHPVLIGIGIALILTLPTVGVLDTAAVRSVNFLLIIFLGGAISLGNVLVETQALATVTSALIDHINPLLTTPFSSALTLYWGGFLYHLPIPNPNAMVSTALPVLLDIADVHH
jgi:anion transporter